MDTIVRKTMEKLSLPSIEIEASGRHVHLNFEAVEILFGKGYKLTKCGDLSQPGQFTCKERISIENGNKIIHNVVILGPERENCQVEISKTDAIKLGVNAPVRQSGDIISSPGMKLIGPVGSLNITFGTIVAKRHIHITPNDAELFGVYDQQCVSVQVFGQRSTTLHDVVVRISSKFETYMHIDFDEANSIGFYKHMRGIVLVPMD